jgi:hypothetical protein
MESFSKISILRRNPFKLSTAGSRVGKNRGKFAEVKMSPPISALNGDDRQPLKIIKPLQNGKITMHLKDTLIGQW